MAYTNITGNDIKSLNPRDEVAMEVLSHLIEKYEKTNIGIAPVVKRAYEYADAMLEQSANIRNANQEGAGTSIADASAGTSSGDTAIVTALSAIATKIESNNNTTELTAVATALGTTLKVDNPDDEEFDVAGAGSILKTSLNDASNIESVVGFLSGNQNNAPVKTTIAALVTLVENVQKTSASSILNWIMHHGTININDLDSFLDAYSQDIWNSFNTDSLFETTGAWYPKIVNIITSKVKAEALR